VQVNGKVRGKIVVPTDAAEDEVISVALSEVGRWVADKEIKRVVVVPGKLVSVVIAG
jgi:leucyl-tRNA synthetase